MKVTSLFIIIIVFFPFIIYNYTFLHSVSIGYFISVLTLIGLLAISKKDIRISKRLSIFYFVILLVFVFSIPSMLFSKSFNLLRFYSSFSFLIITTICSQKITELISRIDEIIFTKTINIIFGTLLFTGLVEILDQLFVDRTKELLFFSEPSHYAITILPFALYKTQTFIKLSNKLLMIMILFILSVVLKNLTLLIGTLMVALLTIKTFKNFITVLFLTTAILITFFSFIQNIDLSYFIERVTFVGSNNLSTLVFLSGWENGINVLKEGNLTGIGFQQLGYITIDGYYRDRLAQLGFANLNIYDGGTTGAKLIAETGVLGISLAILYLIYLYKIIRKSFSQTQIYHRSQFFIAVFIMYSLEFFIRGIGYFSPNSFLFICSLIFLFYLKPNYTFNENSSNS